MSEVFEDLAAYAKRLDERPPGHKRSRHFDALWGTDAWECIPDTERQGLAYGLIEDIWDSAIQLMGLTTSENIDMPGFEELSLQFYPLYADMIREFLRTQRYAG